MYKVIEHNSSKRKKNNFHQVKRDYFKFYIMLITTYNYVFKSKCVASI